MLRKHLFLLRYQQQYASLLINCSSHRHDMQATLRAKPVFIPAHVTASLSFFWTIGLFLLLAVQLVVNAMVCSWGM